MIEPIRCFIAIELPAQIRQKLDDYLRPLKNEFSFVRWVRVEGIHLTLKFLGEISAKQAADIQNTLSLVKFDLPRFKIRIEGSGAFPNQKHPRVIWLGLKQDAENPLYKLQKIIDNELHQIGFEKEKRRFSPHLTLGRLKFNQDTQPLFKYLNHHPFPPVEFNVDAFTLIRSKLKPDGAIYTSLKKFLF